MTISQPRPVLRAEQVERLQSCLKTVQAATTHHMWESCTDALEQLKDFCEGSPNLLPVIGSKEYGTLGILVAVLREREVTSCAKVFALLEVLLYSVRKNQKVFLKLDDGVELLVSFLLDVSTFSQNPEGLGFLDKACILLSCVMKDAKKSFCDAMGYEAIYNMLKGIMACSRAQWNEDWDQVTESLCELIVELAEEDAMQQEYFHSSGALKVMVDLLAASLEDGSLLSERFVEPFLLALSAAVVRNKNNQEFVKNCGVIEILLSYQCLAVKTYEPFYLSSLLLVVNLQYESSELEPLMAHTERNLTRAGETFVRIPIESYMKASSLFREERENIRANHFDSDAVVPSLHQINTTLKDSVEAQYLFMHQKGAVELVIQCCNNIDENVMENACTVGYNLLLNNQRAQVAFLRCNGLYALADCLHDYNVRIKLLALQILSIVSSEHPVCRDEVRDAGILTHIIRMIKDFPAEDVTLRVCDAAVGVLGHVVTENNQNQEYMRNENGLVCVLDVLRYCIEDWAGQSRSERNTSEGNRSEHISNAMMAFAPTAFTSSAFQSANKEESATTTQGSDANKETSQTSTFSLMETSFVTLNNLAFKNNGNQAELREAGALELCMSMLKAVPNEDLLVTTLNLMVNLVDTNAENQTHLCNEATLELVQSLLSMKPRVATMGCLFLSHLSWNHVQNQTVLATTDVIKQLLRMIDAPINDLAITRSLQTSMISGRSSPSSLSSRSSEGRSRELHGHVRVAHRERSAQGGHGGIEGIGGGSLPGPPSVSVTNVYDLKPTVTPEQELEELCFYALMALINLSYQNSAVQDMIDHLDGIEIILKHLGSDIYETRKTATFCLGNLVKGHSDNAQKLVHAGGVERLVQLINDEEEDELSNKAFLTLTNMGELSIRRMVDMTSSVLSTLPERSARSLNGDVDEQGQNAGAQANEHAEACRELEKSLPVLNGLIYLHPENRECMIRIGGMAAILKVFTTQAPEELVVYAGYVLANLSFTRDRTLQTQARDFHAFEILDSFLATVGDEGRMVAYTILNNLTLNNPNNYTYMSDCKHTLEHLVKDCGEGSEEELRLEAADFLLSLFEQDALQEPLVNLGGMQVLQGLLDARISEVITAKSTQLLRDLNR